MPSSYPRIPYGWADFRAIRFAWKTASTSIRPALSTHWKRNATSF